MLRSIRYGEADRILHLYTPRHGRLSRDRQRRAAVTEPLRRPARAVLPRPRSSSTRAAASCSRSPASTRSPPTAPLRDHAATLDAAARACDAVARLFETAEPHPEVFRLLANELALLSSDAVHARPANGLAFRLKLLLAAGIVPQLASCAACGENEHLQGFSAAAGGVVCGSCEAAAFPLARSPTSSWSARSASRWRRPRRHPSGRCARPSGRSRRPPSTTRTFACGRCCARPDPRRRSRRLRQLRVSHPRPAGRTVRIE